MSKNGNYKLQKDILIKTNHVIKVNETFYNTKKETYKVFKPNKFIRRCN